MESPVFLTLSSDEDLSQTLPRPKRSRLDRRILRLLVVPYLRPALRICTTSLRKETHNCCPSWSPFDSEFARSRRLGLAGTTTFSGAIQLPMTATKKT